MMTSMTSSRIAAVPRRVAVGLRQDALRVVNTDRLARHASVIRELPNRDHATFAHLDLAPRARFRVVHMTNMKLDRDTLRALADERNEKALDRLADLADAGSDLAELIDLLEEGSEHAGRLLTRRAVKAHDVIELQRLSDAGSEEAGTELDRILADPSSPNA